MFNITGYVSPPMWCVPRARLEYSEISAARSQAVAADVRVSNHTMTLVRLFAFAAAIAHLLA